MIRRLLSLGREATGTATIELGLLAPILAALLIGLIEVATAYSDKLHLEQVAQRTIEKVQQTSFSTTMEAALETEAKAAAGDGSQADLTWWIECDGVKMTDASAFTSGCSTGQVYARYVQLDIRKPYTPIVPVRYLAKDANGVVELRGVAGIRIQ